MKKNGFTLIELMIVVSIIGIVTAMIVSFSQNSSSMPELFQRGGNLCKNGYQWNVDVNGHQRQVLNVNGGGVLCN